MKGILSILWNEIHLIFFRDIRRGILLICAASAYLLLFSWLYTWGIVNHIPLLIVDQDQSSYSRNLSEKFATSDVFDGKYWGSELTDVEDRRTAQRCPRDPERICEEYTARASKSGARDR